MTTGVQNPSSTDKECGTKYLEFGIHGVESRLQACLRFPFREGDKYVYLARTGMYRGGLLQTLRLREER